MGSPLAVANGDPYFLVQTCPPCLSAPHFSHACLKLHFAYEQPLAELNWWQVAVAFQRRRPRAEPCGVRRLPHPDAVAGRRAPLPVAAPPGEPVPALLGTRRCARPPEAGRPEPRPVVAASVARARAVFRRPRAGDQRDGVAAHVAHRAAMRCNPRRF